MRARVAELRIDIQSKITNYVLWFYVSKYSTSLMPGSVFYKTLLTNHWLQPPQPVALKVRVGLIYGMHLKEKIKPLTLVAPETQVDS